MIIAINTRTLSGDEAAATLLLNWFENIAAQNTAHQFYFISNKEIQLSPLNNIKAVVIKQQSANPLFWKLWYNYKLPAALKKIKAGLLVSADGICCLRTKLPQCLIVNDVEFFHDTTLYNRRHINFIKTNMPLCLNKASAIVVFSESVKKEIRKNFLVEEDKISVVSFDENKKYQRLNREKQNQIKEKHTNSNEYFLFYGLIHSRSSLTNLLKAFSLFKKRQKSSMQLVLLTDTIPEKNEFVESLRLYKYRNEVHLVKVANRDEVIPFIESAFCAVNLSPLYSDIVFLRNALLGGVPVIAGNTPQAKELLADAALYVNPQSVDSIAEQLMIIYKDERRQDELVENGKILMQQKKGKDAWQVIASITTQGDKR